MTTGDFAALEESARTRLERMRRLSDDLAALEIRHTGAGGAVTVIVDGSARLLDIQLSVDISRLSPAEFGRAVIDTAAAAAHRALARRGALIGEFNEQVNS